MKLWAPRSQSERHCIVYFLKLSLEMSPHGAYLTSCGDCYTAPQRGWIKDTFDVKSLDLEAAGVVQLTALNNNPEKALSRSQIL